MNLHLKLLLLTVLLAGRVQELEAASITQSGTVQLPTNHSVASVPNLGTDVTYQDTGSIALPLFDPALGPLTQVAVQLVSFAPNFTGTLTYGPLVSLLSVRCTQNHQISYGFSNGATGSSGPLGG